MADDGGHTSDWSVGPMMPFYDSGLELRSREELREVSNVHEGEKFMLWLSNGTGLMYKFDGESSKFVRVNLKGEPI